jgi:hypothetical protein
MYCWKPYLFVGAEELKFKSRCLMKYEPRVHDVSYCYVRQPLPETQHDSVVAMIRTCATEGSEGPTGCLQLTRTRDM